MRVNFEQLRTFLMVVRFGGVRRASEHMHLSQPAVTARIQNLEESLSAKLFDRASGGMTLTKRGDALMKYAEQYLQLGELIQRDIVDPTGIDLHLRIGVSETIVQSWLPEFVAKLRGEFPQLAIDIAVDISSNLREGLLNRSFDLTILLGPVSEFTVDNVDLPDVPLRWYCSKNAELSDDPAEIFLSNPVVTYARNTRPYRELKSELFNRYGPGISLFPSSSLSAGFRMVVAGLGVAALPASLAEAELKADQVREFDPGWQPNALRFTASYLGDPQSFLVERAAKIAREAALDADK
ncbi:MAG: LysR family transcriptional regulator [Hyphomicrobiales bacterium]